MRIIFLGTGGYHPSERRHTAGVFLPELGIALDAGSGFFRAQQHLRQKTLDIFLTHSHLDHICGLTFFLVPVLDGTVENVRVHGSSETISAVREHLFAPAIFPVMPPFEWLELNTESKVPLAQDGVLSCIKLEHPGGSLGFRLDWPDRSLAYITDTTAPGEYLPFIKDVDVLIHECYFPDELGDLAAKTGHSASTEVAKIARESRAKRVYLVHTDPQRSDDDPVGLEAMRDIYSPIELVEDQQEIVL